MISSFFLRKERLCHIAGRHARHAVGRDYLSRRVFHFPRKCGKLLRMRKFEVVSPFAPSGDQGEAIDRLSAGFLRGDRFQTLKGVTGSGKTFTMAQIIERIESRQGLRTLDAAAEIGLGKRGYRLVEVK